MPAEIYLMRISGSSFSPADESSKEAADDIPIGSVVKAMVTVPRNLKFHKKLFALLNLGYENWEPPKQEWKGIQAVKSFEVYREQVIILAGYRTVTHNLDGSVKVAARSISFAKMDEITFNKLYTAVFSVIWRKVLSNRKGWSEDEMRRVLGCLEGFV